MSSGHHKRVLHLPVQRNRSEAMRLIRAFAIAVAVGLLVVSCGLLIDEPSQAVYETTSVEISVEFLEKCWERRKRIKFRGSL